MSDTKTTGFTDAERAAMVERAKEAKAEKRRVSKAEKAALAEQDALVAVPQQREPAAHVLLADPRRPEQRGCRLRRWRERGQVHRQRAPQLGVSLEKLLQVHAVHVLC